MPARRNAMAPGRIVLHMRQIGRNGYRSERSRGFGCSSARAGQLISFMKSIN
jgi:hypothetical protein